LQYHPHHRDCKERFEKPVAVPIENTDCIARLHAKLFQSGREPSNALSKLPVAKAHSIAIDDLLIRRL
jgi:hypothetical protein